MSSSISTPRRGAGSVRAAQLLRFGDTSWARAHIDTLLPALGSFQAELTGPLAAILAFCAYAVMADDVKAALTKHTPRTANDWERIRAFTQDACALAAPETAYAASLLMTVAVPFVAWCVNEQGWPMRADVVFSRQAIDMYVTLENRKKSEGTRRNYRAMLMRISEVVVPEEHPDPLTPLSRKRIASPYTVAEMANFRKWAAAQAYGPKRYRAMLMLVLCAGAGLRSSDISSLYAADILIDDRGVLINVHGTNPRVVPLRREWESWMVALLEQAPADEPLWGKPNRTDKSNLLSSFTQYTVGTFPRSDRLRATWIVEHLQAGTPIKELFRAAGLEKMENLPRYLEYVSSLEVDDYRAALRGEAEL